MFLLIVLFKLNVISTDKDWEDIKFGVDNEVDFYAVSFVKDSKVVHELKDYLKSKSVTLDYSDTVFVYLCSIFLQLKI